MSILVDVNFGRWFLKIPRITAKYSPLIYGKFSQGVIPRKSSLLQPPL